MLDSTVGGEDVFSRDPLESAQGSELHLDTPRRLFERIVLRHGSLRGLGEKCGRSSMWIWRQLRQNKGVDLVKTARVLQLLGIPIRYFYEEILAESPRYDPSWILLHFREGNKDQKRDPFLAALHYRFHRLLDHPLGSAAPPPRRFKEIEALEAERLFDRAAAKRQLEKLGHELLTSAETAAPRGVHRWHLADCADLLLVWGVIQRTCGRRDDATDAYVLAYKLASKSGDTRVLGLFYQRASYLLSELGQPNQGLRFAEKSCRLLRSSRDSGLVAGALVQLTVALADLQQFREARIEAVATLRVASRYDWRSRASVWIILGNIALSHGEYRKALGKFARAQGIAKTDYLKACIHWRKAVAFGQLQSTENAALAFREAIDLFEACGQPLDVAFVAVDLAEMLMQQGQFAETLGLVQALSPSFERLSTNAQAFRLWMDLCALILSGSKRGSVEQISIIRTALKEADPKIRPHP